VLTVLAVDGFVTGREDGGSEDVNVPTTKIRRVDFTR
jgi:hypothetical protein